MFCSECGKQIPDNTKFCNHCGAQQPALGSTEPQSAPQPAPQPQWTPQPQPQPAPQPQWTPQPQQVSQPQPVQKKKTNIKLVVGAAMTVSMAIFTITGLSDGSLQEKFAEESYVISYCLLGAIGLYLVISELLRNRK